MNPFSEKLCEYISQTQELNLVEMIPRWKNNFKKQLSQTVLEMVFKEEKIRKSSYHILSLILVPNSHHFF